MLLTENFPFNLELLPATAYLVGGAVRDALLERKREYLDLDFVLTEKAVETAQKIAQHYHAGFVVLDAQRQIARIVFPEGTVDLAQQEGDTLEQDLRRRDFTVNAIAYSFHRGELFDPLAGLKDLEEKILRMISVANLEDDPLRLLRAYRQAAQLNFSIEANTQLALRSLAPLLAKIAPERVKTELGYLLRHEKGNHWLSFAWEDNLLKPWLSHLTREKLEQLDKIEELATQFQLQQEDIYLAKLANLVSSVPAIAEEELIRLKYSRAEIRTVTTIWKNLPRLEEPQIIRLREQYFFFLEVKEVFPILAVLAWILGVSEVIITALMEHYRNPQDQVAHPVPLVTGKDLMQALAISPSPLIGELLTKIQIARIEGKIATREEALNLAEVLISHQDRSNKEN